MPLGGSLQQFREQARDLVLDVLPQENRGVEEGLGSDDGRFGQDLVDGGLVDQGVPPGT